ncbi:MAG: hypothetical protein K6G10_04130 [Butyrivibrio sp.]|nr:hypothetical protein [Butyrivibrio sp.]
MYKNIIEIDIFRCIRALMKKWRFVAVFTGLFLLAGIGRNLDPGVDTYSALATVYAAADGSYSDSANAVTAMNAYLDVASSYKVSQRAALIMGRSDVDASYIQDCMYVSSSAKTASNGTISNFMTSSATIIYFYATTSDPQLSMEMADAMAQSYTIEMTGILNNDSIKLLDKAYTYSKAYNAKKQALKKIIIFTAIGFLLACLIVVACEVFDRKVRTIREASIREELPVLGIIPDYKE